MHTLEKHTLGFAVALAALAGFVDVAGYLKLGGYFVSFMSGNSTQLAVALTRGKPALIVLLSSILACFVAGAMAGTAVSHEAKPEKRTLLVLGLVTLFLAIATSCHTAGYSFAAIPLMTFAMGAVNSAVQGSADSIVGVTYMTGTLVKMGQKLARALLGEEKWAWFPYLLLWLGLMTGGLAGAVAYSFMGLNSLCIATVWSAGLTLIAFRRK